MQCTLVLRACLKSPAPRRVRARGLQITGDFDLGCRPGALTGRVFRQGLKSALLAVLMAALGFGCASTEPTLPPEKIAPPASSPAEVLRALPGTWTIDVEASADSLARAQYKPRLATVLHREGNTAATRETRTVVERFDAKAYREALTYWLDLLDKPDMRWRLKFNAAGTGEHWAVVKTGSAPQNTPFTWRLNGWRLHIDYAADAPFKSFDIEMPSAKALHYPMQPLGDHLVLRPGK